MTTVDIKPPETITIDAWIAEPGNAIETARLVHALREARALLEFFAEQPTKTHACRLGQQAARLLATWRGEP